VSELGKVVRLFINLTPLIYPKNQDFWGPLNPPLLRKRGGRILREASPLFNSLLIPTMLKERGKRVRGIGY